MQQKIKTYIYIQGKKTTQYKNKLQSLKNKINLNK